ncbi:uncharacterized protein EI90DRAFT_3149838 [Cantharellus anzutake]|uniref:uncharacterized protein n=1 Tax=Cantharellus anzutake TaxID=1750568 RepID=UPI0019060793|nr:uncharacterized protein EI90DRAFT_3149838 [Cantharellus anzutake]KAF8342754.1 hypothetical protein EI90DRAFT_3149838 [Cantharellus anzutake]
MSPPSPKTPLQRVFAACPIEWVGEVKPIPDKPNGLYEGRRFMFKGHKWERELPAREQALHDFKVEHDQKRRAILDRRKRLERKAEEKRRGAGILS